MKRIILNIGEIAVSKDAAVLETILGSCVAVCLWDHNRRIGGLNHYLLPAEQPGAEKSIKYGTTSIDTLIEEMVDIGAEVRNMRAQLFGGGSIITRGDDVLNIGAENVNTAREKLEEYGIPIVGAHVSDKNGIRVVFRTATGVVTVRPLGSDARRVPEHENDEFRRQMQPCKTCIMCGSCGELFKRKRRVR